MAFRHSNCCGRLCKGQLKHRDLSVNRLSAAAFDPTSDHPIAAHKVILTYGDCW
jgi:hypothetical protein